MRIDSQFRNQFFVRRCYFFGKHALKHTGTCATDLPVGAKVRLHRRQISAKITLPITCSKTCLPMLPVHPVLLNCPNLINWVLRDAVTEAEPATDCPLTRVSTMDGTGIKWRDVSSSRPRCEKRGPSRTLHARMYRVYDVPHRTVDTQSGMPLNHRTDRWVVWMIPDRAQCPTRPLPSVSSRRHRRCSQSMCLQTQFFSHISCVFTHSFHLHQTAGIVRKRRWIESLAMTL
jgi:hypothetical protein